MSWRIHPTWLEVDLPALAHNVRRLREIAGADLMAVVKAEGYGHGSVEVARAALAAGAKWVGVARVQEGCALRQAGLAGPILVLGVAAPEEVDRALGADLALTVPALELAQATAGRARALGRVAAVHLKVDTGMGRLGVVPEEAIALARTVAATEGLALEGLFTHLARADEADLGPTQLQLDRFFAVIAGLRGLGLLPRWVHAANSAATLALPRSRLGLVRVGIAMYGLHPSEAVRLPPDFRPVLSWKAQLVSAKTLPAGWGVSYGHEYVTRSAERIGVVPVGYGDGWRRAAPNEVLIEGRRRPVLGRMCMDQCMVPLSASEDLGTEVVLIGRQGTETISAEEVGRRWGTNNYEVVTGIAGRVPRQYLR